MVFAFIIAFIAIRLLAQKGFIMVTFYYVQFMLYGLRNTLVFKSQWAMNNFVNHSKEYYGDDFEVIAFFDRIA